MGKSHNTKYPTEHKSHRQNHNNYGVKGEPCGADLNPFICGFGDFCQDDGRLENPYGNNPAPFTNLCNKNEEGEPMNVCDECNKEIVIKGRIFQAQNQKFAIQLAAPTCPDNRSGICYKLVEGGEMRGGERHGEKRYEK